MFLIRPVFRVKHEGEDGALGVAAACGRALATGLKETLVYRVEGSGFYVICPTALSVRRSSARALDRESAAWKSCMTSAMCRNPCSDVRGALFVICRWCPAVRQRLLYIIWMSRVNESGKSLGVALIGGRAGPCTGGRYPRLAMRFISS